MEIKTDVLVPAPVWRRLAAMVYDTFLVLSIAFLVGFINLGIQLSLYGADQLKAWTDSGESLGGPVFYSTLFLVIFGFFAFFWTRRGQTLGMQAWRLYILNETGDNISMKQALIRFLVAVPALLSGCLGVIWVWWDRDSKSWQDHASGSRTYLLPVAKK